MVNFGVSCGLRFTVLLRFVLTFLGKPNPPWPFFSGRKFCTPLLKQVANVWLASWVHSSSVGGYTLGVSSYNVVSSVPIGSTVDTSGHFDKTSDNCPDLTVDILINLSQVLQPCGGHFNRRAFLGVGLPLRLCSCQGQSR